MRIKYVFKCCVPECRNIESKSTKNIQFFNLNIFSSNQKWVQDLAEITYLEVVGNNKQKIRKICSEHFLDEDYVTIAGGMRILKPSAIPKKYKNTAEEKEKKIALFGPEITIEALPIFSKKTNKLQIIDVEPNKSDKTNFNDHLTSSNELKKNGNKNLGNIIGKRKSATVEQEVVKKLNNVENFDALKPIISMEQNYFKNLFPENPVNQIDLVATTKKIKIKKSKNLNILITDSGRNVLPTNDSVLAEDEKHCTANSYNKEGSTNSRNLVDLQQFPNASIAHFKSEVELIRLTSNEATNETNTKNISQPGFYNNKKPENMFPSLEIIPIDIENDFQVKKLSTSLPSITLHKYPMNDSNVNASASEKCITMTTMENALVENLLKNGLMATSNTSNVLKNFIDLTEEDCKVGCKQNRQIVKKATSPSRNSMPSGLKQKNSFHEPIIDIKNEKLFKTKIGNIFIINMKMLLFDCKYCNEDFKTFAEFREHFENNHSVTDEAALNPGEKSCRIREKCGEILTYSNEISLFCLYCETGLKAKDIMLDHLEKNHLLLMAEKLESPNIFTVISEPISNNQDLENDGDSKNNVKSDSDFAQQQQDNNISIDNLRKKCATNLKTRILEKPLHNRRPKKYPCSYCSKMFPCNFTLKNHIRTHTKEKPFECSCGKSFSTLFILENHKRIHTGLRPYKCSYENECSMKFFRRSNLLAHIKAIHSKEKIYKCSDCDKSFPLKDRLDRHKLSHTGVKNFKCSIDQCQSAFYRLEHKQRHESRHFKEPYLSCKFCSEKFSLKSQKIEHEKKSHENDEVKYKCHKIDCKVIFENIYEREKHKIKIHPELVKNICSNCKKKFITSYALKTHVIACERNIKNDDDDDNDQNNETNKKTSKDGRNNKMKSIQKCKKLKKSKKYF